jgi:hypothetical protein
METRQNMRNALKATSLAALMALGAGFAAGPSVAQDFGIRIGPDRPRVIERRGYRDDEVVERRVIRRAEPRRTVCTTRWRDGRRVEVCRSGGPRY